MALFSLNENGVPPRVRDKRNRPVIAHVIFRLQTGGLENGLVNLINHTAERYRHIIICLRDSTDFAQRIQQSDLAIYALHKREGKDPIIYFRLWRLLQGIKPSIVHTRNLAALEMQGPAALAGVPIRIHGEHGWDIHDPEGKNWRYRWLRRLHQPLIHQYIALSRPIVNYLCENVGIPPLRIKHIYNGVDTKRFHPKRDRSLLPTGFAAEDSLIIGTVGRLEPIKDQLTLVQAFVNLVRRIPGSENYLRLVVIGEGSLRPQLESLITEADMTQLVWFAGERADVSALLQSMDIFVLPSLAEGISNTILEAMATGLPVVATRVGGNPELVADTLTGYLIPAADPGAMADSLASYVQNQNLIEEQGQAARRRVEEKFGIKSMVAQYTTLYDTLLAARLGKKAYPFQSEDIDG
ncbi:sugar transferase, PEP-CTERM/EpsH1 system associated [Nitrosococcus halophilus Nc 4]|uniref:Sugar transferase, PEP-CTERM/EpsH1 system associated n=1 Tax=Nitrosococcus halophilus (strain Nc4) TaxID=472759 RepID=D5C039_NITHN|nr:TIGR03088 family PEP-CTERM/XrtA system glycosyltransferase [Nitrosococcus halophilus]ADE16286.1 sugar transferase, PEP-CTERM/EpsH1 system associated [Nitrosococcus halophilus Nc 4]